MRSSNHWRSHSAVAQNAAGGVSNAFPSKGRSFATTQSHWFRVQDGMVIEHWANRDDQGTAMQLGWIPPTPMFLFKAWRATRRARRREATRPRYA